MKILIIDDIKENLYFLETLLKGFEYEVITAVNGKDALEKLRKDSFDMTISDILMPEMDGFQLLKNVKSDNNLWDMPFIFYTATYTDENDKEFGLNLGACAYIEKPIDPNELIKIIQDIFKDYESGKFISKKPKLKDEKEIFKLYNEALVNKLEKKMLDLEREVVMRKQTEKELLKLSTAIEQSESTIVITDTKGNIEYTNPKFTDLTGYTVGEVFGKNQRILKSGTHPKEFYTQIWRTITAGNTWKGEIHNKSKNGNFFWEQQIITPVKNTDGKITNFIAVKEDITERIKNEQEILKAKKKIEKSELELKEAQRIGHLGSWYLNFTNNEVLWTEELFQMYDFDSTLPPPLYNEHKKFFTSESWHDLKEAIIKIRKNGIPYELELEINRKDSSNGWMWMRGELVKDTNGVIVGLRSVAQDITERKKGEFKLIKAKEKAEESDLLKTEFINNMSHEIRTPLNGILGFSGMLNNPNLSDEKRTNFVKIIQSSGDQLLKIIDDILEISSLGTKQVKVKETDVCLNDLLLKLFSVFDIKAKENKTPLYFKKALSDKGSTILIDRSKLNKIVSNLLENAIKFTNEGFIELGYQLKNNELEIFIKDTGIGIEQAKHESIFERFSQVEKDLSKIVGGLGLGLSIAKENTELLGGNIRLESKKGDGTTFFVTIPYKPVYKGIDMNEEDGAIQHKHFILIAEDEEVNFLYLETLLKEVIGLNCEIIHAKNGQEAVDFCSEKSAIDLVLMDLKMPVMSGFEATKQLKKIYPDLPIIAQTAFSSQKDQEKAKLAGCDDFLPKPIRQETMSLILKKYSIMSSDTK